MRVAAIFAPDRRDRYWQPFHQASAAEWSVGLPASTADADAVLIFGGDGTIHRHLADLVRLQIPVLVVPCGSGNDMARALGLQSRSDSLAAWRNFCEGNGVVRAIDLGLIQTERTSTNGENESSAAQGHYFCTVGGVGLDAEVARRANALPRWLRRWGGYVISLLPALVKPNAMKMTVHVVGEEAPPVRARARSSILTAFANTPAYGGGMRIAPRAKLDDGKLDTCIIGDIGTLKLLCLFPTVFFGRHLGIAQVEYFQAEHLRVETREPVDVYADGEFVCRTPIEVRVARGALRVIVKVHC